MDADALVSSMDDAWNKFVHSSQMDTAIRSDIAESWLRCSRSKVDPADGLPQSRLATPRLHRLLEEKSDLLIAARPFVERLYKVVADTGFIIMLANEDGYILDILGDREALDSAAEINLGPGFHWIEDEAGTNGIGTALACRSAVQVSGAEHFCRKVQSWTCSAAPIVTGPGRVQGVLQVSGPACEANKHTLGMVVASVEAIGELIRGRKRPEAEVRIDNALKSVWNRSTDGIIVVDRAGRIDHVNSAAQGILQRNESEVKGRSLAEFVDRTKEVSEILESGCSFDRKGIILKTDAGRVHCISDGKPIRGEGSEEIEGAVLFVDPIGRRRGSGDVGGRSALCHFDDILGENPRFLEMVRLAIHAADNDSNVLLSGESGTGKDIFAQAIHSASSRRNGPFIAVNCGAMPKDLIVSELFGYVEGAFTGARRGGRPGKFEQASGGTLFLDEIGELPLEQQVVLLRVLQDKRITRLGGGSEEVADARIICASNKDLRGEVKKGTFRTDLYYRINVIPIGLPPLRERRDDIPILVRAFLADICSKLGVRNSPVSPGVMEVLEEYDWPGNIRELQNVLERMTNMAAMDGEGIRLEHVPCEVREGRLRGKENSDLAIYGDPGLSKPNMRALWDEMDRRQIISHIAMHRGNMSKAAKALDISRATLYRKMRKLRIERPEP